jgi:hypothetical protein
MLKLKPDTAYRVRLDYLNDTTNCFAFVAGNDAGGSEKITLKLPLPHASWKVQKFSTTLQTDGQDDWFIGLTKLERKRHGTLVIDNVLVEELPGRKAIR